MILHTILTLSKVRGVKKSQLPAKRRIYRIKPITNFSTLDLYELYGTRGTRVPDTSERVWPGLMKKKQHKRSGE